MGGILIDEKNQPVLSDGFVIPDTAANNNFDMESAIWLYEQLQKEQIKLNISTRHMAYACPIEKDFYEKISFSKVGKCLSDRQSKSLIELYKSTLKSGAERTLPERCSPQWFLNTFTDEKEFSGNPDDVFSICTKINVYDPLNLMILVDEFENNFLEKKEISENVSIYGVSPEETGFKDPKGAKVFFTNKIVETIQEIEDFKKCDVEEFIKKDMEKLRDKQSDLIRIYIFDFLKEKENKGKILEDLKETYKVLYKTYYKKDDRERAGQYKYVLEKLDLYLKFENYKKGE